MSDQAAGTHVRSEFERAQLTIPHDLDVARDLGLFEKFRNINAVRKLTILLGLVAAWQIYTMIASPNPLLFPSFLSSLDALWETALSGVILERVWVSLKVLLMGYAAGLALAALLLIFAQATRIGADFLTTMAAMFQPLPAISLLPLAMLWFGLGMPALVFVTIHSVLWAVALSTHVGFMGVSHTLRMVGRNYGLRGIPYIFQILVPAAFSSILTGMKIGWAFAWRTLIGAEMIFGAAGKGGLGWFISVNGENLETATLFAGLFAVIVVGLVVENLIFRNVEIKTVNKWGMQR